MSPRLAEVWGRLDLVTDPELDDSVTDMDFIEAVDIGEEGDVLVCFRLPTYWCSPNFAFLMVADAWDAVSQVPGLADVDVELIDHFASDAINAGVAARAGFVHSMAGSEVAMTVESMFSMNSATARISGMMRTGGAPPAEAHG